MITFLSNNAPKEEFVPFPDLAPPPSPKHGFKLNPNLIYALVFSASLIAIGFSAIVIFRNFQSNQQSLDSQPSPTPIAAITQDPAAAYVVLPPGTQTYNFQHGKDITGPKPTQVIIDPLDPGTGGTQTVTLKVAHNSPVLGAAIEVVSDNTTSRQTLSLTQGNNTQGTWSGTWSITDSYDSRYGIKIMLQSINRASPARRA